MKHASAHNRLFLTRQENLARRTHIFSFLGIFPSLSERFFSKKKKKMIEEQKLRKFHVVDPASETVEERQKKKRKKKTKKKKESSRNMLRRRHDNKNNNNVVVPSTNKMSLSSSETLPRLASYTKERLQNNEMEFPINGECECFCLCVSATQVYSSCSLFVFGLLSYAP